MDIRELDLRRNVSAIDVAKERTYSHAPPSAAFDISNVGGYVPLEPNGEYMPYGAAGNRWSGQGDPLTEFLAQSSAGVKQTEADRVGADRWGETWPMMRAQRLHGGDSHMLTSVMRRIYSHSRIGQIFTPLEIPQNPSWAAYPRSAYANPAPPD